MEKVSEKIKDYVASRGVGYILTFPAIIFAILAAVFYKNNGVTEFNPELNSAAMSFMWAGVALSAVSLVIDIIPLEVAEEFVKPLRIAAYLLYLYAFLQFIMSQVTYISNVFVAIDGNTFSGGFIATLVFYVLAIVLTLVAACLNFWTPWLKGRGKTASAEAESEVNDEKI